MMQLSAVDEVLPFSRLLFLGLQHVLVMYAGDVAVPLIVSETLHLPASETVMLINSSLFVAGIVTLIQCLGVWKFGARLPVIVLHTWGQNLLHHPHLHCVIPAVDPSPLSLLPARGRTQPRLPRKIRRRFKTPIPPATTYFRRNSQAPRKPASLPLLLAPTVPPKLGRLCQATLRWSPSLLGYLARYTHRVAITNQRLLAFEHDQVTFRWKDYAHGHKKKKMTLSSQEFLRRFLLHVLPRGFVRIRFFGFLANRRRSKLLPRCQRLLFDNPKPHAPALTSSSPAPPACFRCPKCATPMFIIERLSPWTLWQLSIRSPAIDSS